MPSIYSNHGNKHAGIITEILKRTKAGGLSIAVDVAGSVAQDFIVDLERYKPPQQD